jgi:hypothetical protein
MNVIDHNEKAVIAKTNSLKNLFKKYITRIIFYFLKKILITLVLSKFNYFALLIYWFNKSSFLSSIIN